MRRFSCSIHARASAPSIRSYWSPGSRCPSKSQPAVYGSLVRRAGFGAQVQVAVGRAERVRKDNFQIDSRDRQDGGGPVSPFGQT